MIRGEKEEEEEEGEEEEEEDIPLVSRTVIVDEVVLEFIRIRKRVFVLARLVHKEPRHILHCVNGILRMRNIIYIR